MNRVTLMGRLTREPELRHTNVAEKAVVNFTLAVDRKHSGKNDEKVADFFNIVTWGKLAEFCNNYFKKGLKVVVSGRLQTRSWLDSEGNKKFTVEVIANEAYFAEGKRTSDARDYESVQNIDIHEEELSEVS